MENSSQINFETDQEVDLSKIDWEEVQGEIEALEVIFPGQLKITHKKPYSFKFTINSSDEKEDNYVSLLLIAQMPFDYP